jgi:hypothetical protein
MELLFSVSEVFTFNYYYVILCHINNNLYVIAIVKYKPYKYEPIDQSSKHKINLVYSNSTQTGP